MGEIKGDNIEAFAVAEVEKILRKTGRVVTEIPTGDKSPSWDGNIFLYHETQKSAFNKSDLIAKIPVQVKGREVKEFSSKFTKKSFKKADLGNYYNDNGVIIFLVELKYDEEDEYNAKIFCSNLLPLDLRDLFDKMKSQLSITVKFSAFEKGKKNIINFLDSFVEEKKRQPINLVEKRIDISKVNNVLFSAKETVNHISELVGTECYLYGELGAENIEVPISNAIFSTIIGDDDEIIGIKGRVFYNKIKRIFSVGEMKIEFGNKVTLIGEGKKFRINMKSESSTLDEAILLSEFTLGLIEHREFEFNGSVIACNKFDIKEKDISSIKSDYSIFKKIKNVFEHLNIEYTGDIHELTEYDTETILRIYDYVYDGKGIMLKCNDDFCTATVEILELKFLFWAIKDDDGKYKIYDYFEYVEKHFIVVLEVGDLSETISPFVELKTSDIKAHNFNENIIYESIVKFELKSVYVDHIIKFILNIILSYDIHNTNHLDLAVRLLDFLSDRNAIEEEIYIVNKYQVKLREEGTLTDIERRDLVKIKVESNDDSIKCACCILLGDKSEFEYWFEKIKEPENFKEYPIYNLLS